MAGLTKLERLHKDIKNLIFDADELQKKIDMEFDVVIKDYVMIRMNELRAQAKKLISELKKLEGEE